MPIFEYKCNKCSSKFEILHKWSVNTTDVTCPNCNSTDSKKLFSAFSASVKGNAVSGFDCSTGNCGVDYSGGCASGNCALN